MTLENTLRHQLNNPEPGGFHFHAGGWNVTLAADKNDSLSCALKELCLEKNAPIQEELKPWATRVAEHVTGLLEPLRLIEADQLLGKALLRSETPTVRDGKSFYYELLLVRTDRTFATLHRYAGQNGEKREAVPFVLTHDAIVKLVTDIVGMN
jgi:hypothetical protein